MNSENTAKNAEYMRDTDYLHASARVRALGNQLVREQDVQRMIGARNFDEAFKIWADKSAAGTVSADDTERALSETLEETYRSVAAMTGDAEVFRIFRLRYDGHNLKALIKAGHAGIDAAHLMSALGNVPAETLQTELRDGKLSSLPEKIAEAALLAAEQLAKTGDPQLVDVLMDRAVLESEALLAAGYKNEIIGELVRVRIDMANLRALVRIKRMGKDADFLRRVLADGGALPKERLVQAFPRSYDELFALLNSSQYGTRLAPAYEDLRRELPVSRFERLCDAIFAETVEKANRKPFGIEPVIAYLFLREAEIKTVRVVLTSKKAGAAPEVIEERVKAV